MTAALPHCDALVSGHSFEALAGGGRRRSAPRRGREGVAGSGLEDRVPAREPSAEPWASATPVAGSSVAMPSGMEPEPGQDHAWMGGQDGA